MRRKPITNDAAVGCAVLAVYGIYGALVLTFMGALILLILKLAARI